MIECIFTLDYEIYGNGDGALRDLIYEPGEVLKAIFNKWNVRFVNFVEVAELEKIDTHGTDSAIHDVKRQVRELHDEGFEIALHLHPQWHNARYDSNRWLLDPDEYNLCTLSRDRIAEIIGSSLAYLRHLVDEPRFTPLCFRAGNWLFQPTENAASVLAEHGIKIDSSVFKGGLQRSHRLDYRLARRNGYCWSFSSDVNVPDPDGPLIEVPIYTEMVPFWRMATSKRLSFGNGLGMTASNTRAKLNRFRDFARLQYPLKLDFCRMTLDELTSMMNRAIEADRREPARYRPLVAIGHTKDLVDPATVDAFLSFLRTNGIAVSTFRDVYSRLQREQVAWQAN